MKLAYFAAWLRYGELLYWVGLCRRCLLKRGVFSSKLSLLFICPALAGRVCPSEALMVRVRKLELDGGIEKAKSNFTCHVDTVQKYRRR